MKIEFKAIRKRIELGEYAPELSEEHINVQVNVSRELLGRMRNIATATDGEAVAILVELWGTEDWPETDIRALWDHCRENDPQLWTWIINRTWSLVLEYQGFVKKN